MRLPTIRSVAFSQSEVVGKPHRIGRVVLVASGMGFPLSQLALGRFGRREAILVEAVSVGLLTRDVALLATGASHRLRPGPARPEPTWRALGADLAS